MLLKRFSNRMALGCNLATFTPISRIITSFVTNLLSVYQHFDGSASFIESAAIRIIEAGELTSAYSTFWNYINPYGTFRLDMNERLIIENSDEQSATDVELGN